MTLLTDPRPHPEGAAEVAVVAAVGGILIAILAELCMHPWCASAVCMLRCVSGLACVLYVCCTMRLVEWHRSRVCAVSHIPASGDLANSFELGTSGPQHALQRRRQQQRRQRRRASITTGAPSHVCSTHLRRSAMRSHSNSGHGPSSD